MNYLTAVYPIVIFCYILVQNPLQLPLIQTDEEGIVYEQDRLTLGMVAALVQWVMENGGAKDKATSRDQSRADGSGGIGAHHVKERREIIDQIIREEVGDALYFFSESELKNKVILLLFYSFYLVFELFFLPKFYI